jgi:hypothetical protein
VSGVIFWSIKMLNKINNLSFIVLRVTIMAIVLLGCIVTLTGCMSANTESDLPWNTPQSWEGSVSVPGLSPNY